MNSSMSTALLLFAILLGCVTNTAHASPAGTANSCQTASGGPTNGHDSDSGCADESGDCVGRFGVGVVYDPTWQHILSLGRPRSAGEMRDASCDEPSLQAAASLRPVPPAASVSVVGMAQCWEVGLS